MVAIKSPSLADTYSVLCEFLRKNSKLTVNVVNHIAKKHGIHSLPAFHTSDAIADEDKRATYKELAHALIAHSGGDRGALGKLQGATAHGQASPSPAPVEPTPFDPAELTRRHDAIIPLPGELKPIADIPPFVGDIPPEEPASPAEPKSRLAIPREEVRAGRVKEEPAPKRPSDPFSDRLRDLLVEVIGEMPAAMDEERVKAIADERDAEVKAGLEATLEEHKDAIASDVTKLFEKAMAEAKANLAPTVTVVTHEFKIGETVRPVAGAIHRQLPQIVAWLQADVPVWLWGQAGGGKTHLARQVAEAMGLPFRCAPIDETITVGKLVGFRNVSNGEFVEGLMYRSYKDGGVQLLDEIDTNATAIASTNSLTANGHYTFPNGEEVTRHKDFRLIAGANTRGTGAVAGYSARIRMDAATLDRFAVIKLDYDPGLELSLTCGVPSASVPWKGGEPATPEQCQRYVEWVQKVRASVGDSVLISPRASYLGVKALRRGIPAAEVAEALVFKLVTPDTRSRIVSSCGEAPR